MRASAGPRVLRRPPFASGRAGGAPAPRWEALRRLAYAALGVTLAAALAWLLYGDALRVREVAVYGTRLLPVSELTAQLDVTERHPLWLRQADLAARLASLPEVASVQVEVFAPGTVEVMVTERQPALIWVAAAQPWLIDEQGLVLRQAAGSWPSLPVVYQADDRFWARGQQLNPRVVGDALRLGRFVSGAFSSDMHLLYREDTGLVVAEQGWLALFDAGGDLGRQRAALTALQSQAGLADGGLTLYDVRAPDRGYVRSLPSAAPRS